MRCCASVAYSLIGSMLCKILQPNFRDMMTVSQRPRAQPRCLGTGPLQPILVGRVGLSTRDLYPSIIDQERRSQGAGEREPNTDYHHGSEPGDEGLVYGTLDLRRRPRVHVLWWLGCPEIGLRRLHLAADLARQVHAI
jgi:hypothetical protein